MKRPIFIVSLFSTIFFVAFLFFAPIFSEESKASLSAVSPTINSNGFNIKSLNISAEKAFLIDKETGLVLYSKNCDVQSGMASTTKIMTSIIILENKNLSDTIKITKESVGIEGSSIYLSEGEIFTVESLLYGLLLESGNDAAVALAIGLSGSVEDFSILMNEKASSLGMKNTNFSNPHGLSDDNHYSTARDMGILACYAMENETFRKIVSTKKAIIKPENSEYIRYCTNHNKLLWSSNDITGIKTGYTKSDGRCLVSSSKTDDTELICVTLNSPDHWNDHLTLLSKGFETFKKRTLAQKGEYAFEILVVGGNKSVILAKNISEITLPLPEDIKINTKIVTPPFVYAPVEKGDIIGELRIFCEDKLIYSFPLCANESVTQKKISFFKKIFG